MSMQFFLDQIAARILALWTIYYCVSVLYRALIERKIKYLDSAFFVFTWSVSYERVSAPFMYWLTFIGYVIGMLGGLGVAIFGWFRASS